MTGKYTCADGGETEATKDIYEGYSALLTPDGQVLAVLTEPEDRNWWRDLAPVVQELNVLSEKIAELQAQVLHLSKKDQ